MPIRGRIGSRRAASRARKKKKNVFPQGTLFKLCLIPRRSCWLPWTSSLARSRQEALADGFFAVVEKAVAVLKRGCSQTGQSTPSLLVLPLAFSLSPLQVVLQGFGGSNDISPAIVATRLAGSFGTKKILAGLRSGGVWLRAACAMKLSLVRPGCKKAPTPSPFDGVKVQF